MAEIKALQYYNIKIVYLIRYLYLIVKGVHASRLHEYECSSQCINFVVVNQYINLNYQTEK
jgi:hypothetical protein